MNNYTFGVWTQAVSWYYSKFGGTRHSLYRAFFALALFPHTFAAQIEPIAMKKPPSLPAITQDVMPGEGWVRGRYHLSGEAVVFDTWTAHRHRVTTLVAGTSVTILSGLSEVEKPDIVRLMSPIPRLNLNPGDQLLRYTERGEGNADFWSKGRWFTDADLGFIQNADGSGCSSSCGAREIETGHKVWWFHILLPDGRTGWTDAIRSLNPN